MSTVRQKTATSPQDNVATIRNKMDNELMLDVGQANEIKLAFRREGAWTNKEIKMLCERKGLLKDVRAVLLGHSEIRPCEHPIDCSGPVFVPDGWSVLPDAEQIASRFTGTLAWTPKAVKLHRSSRQKGSSYIVGNDLKKELAENKVKVYTAHLLDYLLKPENQHLIPEEWKGKVIFFWGTIYRDAGGSLCVRYLGWDGTEWCWNYFWLDFNFFLESDPAAVAA